MGWASADQIFDPVANEVIRQFHAANINRPTARRILATLIEALQARGWDTEGESLGSFRKHDFVVGAFLDCDVEDDELEVV